jgi:AraC family transcriptional activator of tynA and feaB
VLVRESARSALWLGRKTAGEDIVQPLFSTNDVHPRDRFDYWHSIACKNLINHDSQPECRQTFHANMELGNLADMGLVLFENSSMEVSHTARHVAQVTADELFVCRQVAGILALEQNNREAVLTQGDMTLLDPLLPYFGKFSSGSKLLVLKIPRHALQARMGTTRQMTVRSIKPLEAEHSLASAFLAMLPPHTGNLGSAAQEIVKNQALDLIAVSLAKTMEGIRPQVSCARSLALLNVRAAIDARLADPTLDARSVAAAAGISVRYANAVLAQEETSIMRLVQAKRLARCQRALGDPMQAHRTVSEIAYSWGFSDMTHFGRRFKATYGLLPSHYRRLANKT